MERIALQERIIYMIKKYKYAIAVLMVGIALLLLPAMNGKQTSVDTTEQLQQTAKPDITQQLAAILTQIQGAGKVDVLLSVSAGERTVYQTDETVSGGESGSTRIETVIVTDADRVQSGLIQQIVPPVYLGAIVVCQGADRPAVRLAIVEAVSKVTGLGADRISVLKMK